MKYKYITDPIYGEIIFEEDEYWLYELTQTKEFRRLKSIKQLGECSKIFHSANNERFTHSIGVFYICKQFLNHLQPKIPKSDINAILASALLHDIGHGPRSHSFEMYTNHNHEKMTRKIILNPNSEINKILTKNKINIQLVINILNKSKNIPSFYHQIISSQTDADRLDYLVRDSHFIGTNNGTIDVGLVIKWSMINDNKFVFLEKATNLLESILIARFQMFLQIYLNKKIICYERIMIKIFTRIKDLYLQHFNFQDKNNLLYLLKPFLEDKEYDFETFQDFDDNKFDVLIKSLKYEKDKILQALITAYENNLFFECINKKNELLKILNLNEYKKYFYDEFIVEKSIYDHEQPIQIYNSKTKKNENVLKYWNLISNMQNYRYSEKVYFLPKKAIKKIIKK